MKTGVLVTTKKIGFTLLAIKIGWVLELRVC